MPQLDHVTLLSQVFWLFLTFLSFYILIKKQLLENIVSILKSRARFSASMEKEEWSVSPKQAQQNFQAIAQKTKDEYTAITAKMQKNVKDAITLEHKSDLAQKLAVKTKKTLVCLNLQQHVSKIS